MPSNFMRIFCLLVWVANGLGASGQLVDKIAAVVGDDLITLSDIQKAVAFYPEYMSVSGSGDFPESQVLEDLIDTHVIYLEYRDEFSLKDEDFEDVQTSIIKKVGSIEDLESLLRRFAMEWEDLKSLIREKVVFEKVVRERFQMQINIPFPEIERYYNEQYLPIQQRLQLQSRTLVEMTPLIEKHLRRKRTEYRLRGWIAEIKSGYRIRRLLKSSEPTGNKSNEASGGRDEPF